MLENLIAIYALASIISFIPIGMNIEKIYDKIKDDGLKVKHIVIFVLLPFAVILAILTTLVYNLLFFIASKIVISEIMDKTVWKKK